LRGRVFAVDMMLATLAIAVSQLGATAVVDHVDQRAILGGCGLITLTYAVVWRLATRKLSLSPVVAVPRVLSVGDDPAGLPGGDGTGVEAGGLDGDGREDTRGADVGGLDRDGREGA
jgi:hypothetical protein